MTNDNYAELFRDSAEVPVGSIGLVFTQDLDTSIVHNIATVRERGVLAPRETGGLLMALACLVLMEDDDVFSKALKEAARRMESLNAALKTDTFQ